MHNHDIHAGFFVLANKFSQSPLLSMITSSRLPNLCYIICASNYIISSIDPHEYDIDT